MALLDAALRRQLLQTARAAVSRALGVKSSVSAAGPAGEPQSPACGNLRAGAFVTLRLNGHLRGCIGYPEPDRPLREVVERCAVSAALSDPRFPPLTAAESEQIRLEISVLGSIQPVGDISEVEVGRHGLIVELGRRRGLLLPQVATEWKWDAAELASQTCIKAGLPPEAWKNGAALYRFEAEVFGDSV